MIASFALWRPNCFGQKTLPDAFADEMNLGQCQPRSDTAMLLLRVARFCSPSALRPFQIRSNNEPWCFPWFSFPSDVRRDGDREIVSFYAT